MPTKKVELSVLTAPATGAMGVPVLRVEGSSGISVRVPPAGRLLTVGNIGVVGVVPVELPVVPWGTLGT